MRTFRWQVAQAFRAGRRSPTAAAFQFVELIRIVAELPLEGEEPLSPGEREVLEDIRTNGILRLLGLAKRAVEREDDGPTPFVSLHIKAQCPIKTLRAQP